MESMRKSLRRFFADKLGFTGAEKALITLLALGLIIVVARFVLFGSNVTATKTKGALENQQVAKPVNFTEKDVSQ